MQQSIENLLFAGICIAAPGWLILPLHGETGNSSAVAKNQGFLPFADAPIHYRTSRNLDDPVARLQGQLDRNEITLEYESKNGYLRSVLRALRIPISSQTLVFSKMSFQFPHISPSSPRALYFNDNVYVGQVHQRYDPGSAGSDGALGSHKLVRVSESGSARVHNGP